MNTAPLRIKRDLPSVAPALWKAQRAHFRNPAHFIAHYYHPYLGIPGVKMGMKQADLVPLDPELYADFRRWADRHPENQDYLAQKDRMPTVPRWNDEIVEAVVSGRSVFGLTKSLFFAIASAVQRRSEKKRKK